MFEVLLWESERGLPSDPSHQEVQAALDLCAVYETVDIRSINGFSGWTSCTFTNWRKKKHRGNEQCLILALKYPLISSYTETTSTFWTQASTRLTTFHSILLHFEFIRRAVADTRTVVHHEIC